MGTMPKMGTIWSAMRGEMGRRRRPRRTVAASACRCSRKSLTPRAIIDDLRRNAVGQKNGVWLCPNAALWGSHPRRRGFRSEMICPRFREVAWNCQRDLWKEQHSQERPCLDDAGTAFRSGVGNHGEGSLARSWQRSESADK